jgi:hypothetical protein
VLGGRVTEKIKEMASLAWWTAMLLASVWCALSCVVAVGKVVPDAAAAAGWAFALVVGGGAGFVLVACLAMTLLPLAWRAWGAISDQDDRARGLRVEMRLHEIKMLELRHRIERDKAAKDAGYRWVEQEVKS